MSSWSSPVRRRAMLASGLLLSGSVLAWATKPTKYWADLHPPIKLEEIFPKTFGDWRLDPNQPAMIVAPDVQALLDKLYAQTLSRTYVNAQGQRIMLSVAYGGDQSEATQAHRPDVCYPVQGFQIISEENASLAVGNGQLPMRHMVARLAQRNEPVSFWFVVGEHVAVSGEQQKYAELRYSIRGYIPDGLLMRVSSIDPDSVAAYRLQDGFIRDLHDAMRPEHRVYAFGSGLG